MNEFLSVQNSKKTEQDLMNFSYQNLKKTGQARICQDWWSKRLHKVV